MFFVCSIIHSTTHSLSPFFFPLSPQALLGMAELFSEPSRWTRPFIMSHRRARWIPRQILYCEIICSFRIGRVVAGTPGIYKSKCKQMMLISCLIKVSLSFLQWLLLTLSVFFDRGRPGGDIFFAVFLNSEHVHRVHTVEYRDAADKVIAFKSSLFVRRLWVSDCFCPRSRKRKFSWANNAHSAYWLLLTDVGIGFPFSQ